MVVLGSRQGRVFLGKALSSVWFFRMPDAWSDDALRHLLDETCESARERIEATAETLWIETVSDIYHLFHEPYACALRST